MSAEVGRLRDLLGDREREIEGLHEECNDLVSRNERLYDALIPFVEAWRKVEELIGESDLYDEQPYHITVTLGDLRKARALLKRIGCP